jgi:enoyl-CoA hydratase
MFAPPHMMEAFAAKTQKRAPAFPDLAALRKKM